MKKLTLVLSLAAFLTPICSAQSPGNEFLVEIKGAQSIDKLNRKFGTMTLKEIRSNSLYLIGARGNSVSAASLATDSSVESAEVNSKFKLGDDTVTIYLLDGGDRETLNGTDVPKAYSQQPALSIIEADKTRGLSTGAGARVAIVDTGADFFHPALRPWLEPGVDLVSGISAAEDDKQATMALLDSAATTDLNDAEGAASGWGSLLNQGFIRRPGSLPPALGHGTLVAGMVHLVAPDAMLVPIKAFDSDGTTTLSRIVESVYRAMDLRVDVLNMSFSSPQDSPILRKAIDAAKSTGMTVVSAMGNDGRNVGSVFPASYTAVLGVAASDLSDNLASFSNYGKSVSLCAPGTYVISTAAGGKYAIVSGTSFSAPLVSGTAALIVSLRPNGNSEGPMILGSTDKLGLSPNPAGLLGSGRLNVRKSLERVLHDQ
jgi:subtilisin family serine protease